MNYYGQQALQFSQGHRPNHHRTIADPTAYFTRLGDEIADEVTRLRDQMLGRRGPGEGLGEFLIRSSQAQAASREIVFSTHPAFVPETLIEEDATTTEGDPHLARYRANLSTIGDLLAAPI